MYPIDEKHVKKNQPKKLVPELNLSNHDCNGHQLFIRNSKKCWEFKHIHIDVRFRGSDEHLSTKIAVSDPARRK